MERTDNPTLNERPEPVNVGGMDIAADIFAFRMIDGFMWKALLTQLGVTRMFIGRYQVNFIRYGFLHETIQGFLVGACNDLSNDIPFSSNRANDGNLSSSATALLFFISMPILILAANVSFINFNFANKLFKLFILHSGTPAVTHIPASPVVGPRVLTEDNPMDLQRTDALLGHQHQIAYLEPQFQGDLSILKNGMTDDAKTITVLSSTVRILTYPMKLAGLESVYLLGVVATRTSYGPFGPSQVHQELPTNVIVRELLVKGVNGLHMHTIAKTLSGVNTNIVAFSFLFCCQHLGVSPSRVRKAAKGEFAKLTPPGQIIATKEPRCTPVMRFNKLRAGSRLPAWLSSVLIIHPGARGLKRTFTLREYSYTKEEAYQIAREYIRNGTWQSQK